MSHEEKNTALQILIGVIVNFYIVAKIRDLYASGVMDSPQAIQVWADAMFWVIIYSVVFGIVLAIVGTVLISIFEAVITGEVDKSFISDERDKMIANSGNKVTIGFTGFGFIALVAGIKFGFRPIDCLVVLMFCFSLGSLFGEFIKLARYRMSI